MQWISLIQANSVVLIMDINFPIRVRGEAGKLGGSWSSRAEKPVPQEDFSILPDTLQYLSMTKCKEMHRLTSNSCRVLNSFLSQTRHCVWHIIYTSTGIIAFSTAQYMHLVFRLFLDRSTQVSASVSENKMEIVEVSTESTDPQKCYLFVCSIAYAQRIIQCYVCMSCQRKVAFFLLCGKYKPYFLSVCWWEQWERWGI